MATFREQMADFARAELLRQLREGARLSREKAAAEIGVSAKSLYAWEHGGKIKWVNAQKAGAFYGVDPESIVSRDEPGSKMAEMDFTETQLDRIEAKLDEVLRRLGDDGYPPPPDDALRSPRGPEPKPGSNPQSGSGPGTDAPTADG